MKEAWKMCLCSLFLSSFFFFPDSSFFFFILPDFSLLEPKEGKIVTLRYIFSREKERKRIKKKEKEKHKPYHFDCLYFQAHKKVSSFPSFLSLLFFLLLFLLLLSSNFSSIKKDFLLTFWDKFHQVKQFSSLFTSLILFLPSLFLLLSLLSFTRKMSILFQA